jgi:hypothetical protein
MSRFLLATAAGLFFTWTLVPSIAPGRTAAVIAADAAEAVEHLTATAVTVPKAGLRPTAVTVEIVIDRWSPDAERDRLIETLKTERSNAVLTLIRGLPSIGHISTPTSTGASLRFAHARRTEDGGRRIIIVTERPMGADQQTRRRRGTDYPFTIADLRMDSSGSGEGTLAYAAELTHNAKTGTIEIGNYSTEPVRLTSVKSVRAR